MQEASVRNADLDEVDDKQAKQFGDAKDKGGVTEVEKKHAEEIRLCL